MVDYLLGRLPEAERREVTELILADDESYQGMLATEESLIDCYARGEMDAEEQKLLEGTLLAAAEGRIKLRTAQALIERQRLAERQRNRMYWMAAAAVVLVACGLGFGLTSLRQRLTVGSAPIPRAQPPLATILLRLEVYRGTSTVPSVVLPAGSGRVSFAVPLGPADRGGSYEVRLKTPDLGDLVVAGHGGADDTVTFDVDRSSLVAGRYEVEVSVIGTAGRRLIAYSPVDFR